MPTKLNRDLFTKEGWKIVNDLSLRHDVFRPFFSPGPLFQKGFDRLKPGDIIYGPDLKWTTNNTLYKITKEYEFVDIDKKKNKATRKDITIRGWSLFKYKGLFLFFLSSKSKYEYIYINTYIHRRILFNSIITSKNR